MPTMVVSPPMRFGTVAFPLPGHDGDTDSSVGPSSSSRITSFSECVYRGAYPKLRNLRFLETLHLRTIVSLTPKPLTDDDAIAEWARKQNGGAGIHTVHVRTEKPKEETGGLTREGAARALMEVLNSENLPLYVHCLDGVDVTSTLVACLRKIQGWAEPVILSELSRGVHAWAARSASPHDAAPKHLVQFVERFGQPDGVLLPQRDRIPCWLWPRTNLPLLAQDDAWDARPVAVHHPTLQIHFERSESYIAAQQARFGAVWGVFDHTRSRTPSSLSISDASEAAADSSLAGSGGAIHDAAHTSRHACDSVDEQAAMLGHAPSGPYERLYPPVDDHDLRTPRAKPQRDDGDVPPLLSPRPTADVPGSWPLPLVPEDRTPLVTAHDAHGRRGNEPGRDDIPPLGLSQARDTNGAHVDERRDVEDASEPMDWVDDEDDEFADDDEDDEFMENPRLALEALDIEGY